MQKKELSTIYEPHAVEDRWIDFWLKNKIFSKDQNRKGAKPFAVVIPPPNVTGCLHMGHALNSTLQDCLVRYHRMCGDDVLWVVGTDHAGIATQNVVERQLVAEGKNRFELGREKFVERVWKWKGESGGTIISQLKRLGASCDYDNERFTMDEGLSAAVRKVFVQLYNEKLIYRGERLINWCPRCHTALSDLEVEHETKKASLWLIKYPLGVEFLVVATTRPETLFGDEAVAVHPDDERYKNWIGKKVELPLTGRSIPVIADDYVEREFGSGVVKIAPAHDFNDYIVGQRHKLKLNNIFDESAILNKSVPQDFQGLERFKARKKVLEKLTEAGLLVEEKEHQSAVGHCYRCRTIVEPYLSKQWFVNTKPLADKAIAAVKKGETKFIPEHWEKTYFNWMENIQDWCISRQIWWGHVIPAWYCEKCPPIISETPPKKCPNCGGTNLTQDTDVLDTWFSSALWPFSTLGWPDKTEELKKYYPTSVLVTAFDIIFFWVARMMMMGIHFMKEVPFKDVHIHALVRDPLGQKMSKSKGNVVDPLVMMHKYGTDAFRFTLAAFAAQGRDIKLDEARIEGYRNFCNKIWNASRFAMMTANQFRENKPIQKPNPSHRVNQWILTRLSQSISQVKEGIENYQFNHAASELYTFFWNSFCDWYLELTKDIYKQGSEGDKIETAQTTFFVLDCAMRLMHPFIPFITEEIWQMLEDRSEHSISQASFPQSFSIETYQKSNQEIELLTGVISAIRAIRQETGVSLSAEVDIKIQAPKKDHHLYEDIRPMMKSLGKVKDFTFVSSDPPEPSAVAQAGDHIVFVPFQGLIDATKEKQRLDKKFSKIQKEKEGIKKQLESSDFQKNAPEELVVEKHGQLARVVGEEELITRALKML